MLVRGFVLLCSFLAAKAAWAGNTYYVAPTGDDATSGSLESPFRTLAKAVSPLKPFPGRRLWGIGLTNTP